MARMSTNAHLNFISRMSRGIQEIGAVENLIILWHNKSSKIKFAQEKNMLIKIGNFECT